MAHASGGKATGTAGVIGRLRRAVVRRIVRARTAGFAMGIAMLLVTVLVTSLVPQTAALAAAQEDPSVTDSQVTTDPSVDGTSAAPGADGAVPGDSVTDASAATDTGATDAGTTDAGTTDAGTTDAGTTDAGATDGATDGAQADMFARAEAFAVVQDGQLGVTAVPTPGQIQFVIRKQVADVNGLNPVSGGAGWNVSMSLPRPAAGLTVSWSPAAGVQTTAADGTARWVATVNTDTVSGTFVTSESVPAGYVLDSLTCTVTDVNGTTTVTGVKNVQQLGLHGGQVVECTYVNRPLGTTMSCSAGYVYSITSSGYIQRLYNGFNSTLPGKFTGVIGDVNGLAITADGSTVWAYDRSSTDDINFAPQIRSIMKYDAATRTFTTIPGTGFIAGPSLIFVVGGYDNKLNRYVIGGYEQVNGRDILQLWAYDSVTYARTYLGSADTGASLGGSVNGDIAFDSNGNLFALRSLNSDVQIVSITAAAMAAANGGSLPTFSMTAGSQPAIINPNGIAFDTDGTIWLGNSTTAARFDPITWTQIGGTTTLTGDTAGVSSDLASCASPASLIVRKNVVGRVASTDQFRLYAGSSGRPFAVATTTGTAVGVQAVQAGPAVVVRGATYSFGETLAGTTDFANYVTTWSCVLIDTGQVLASGSGTAGSVTIPSVANANTQCTITNAPKTSKVVMRKIVQDSAGGNPQPGVGWTMDAPLSAVTPAGTVATSGGAQQTTATGSTQWTLTYTDPNGSATLTPAETQQTGFTFISGSCTVISADGSTRSVTMASAAGSTVTGVGPGSTVDCAYTNRVSPTGTITWSKVDRQGALLSGSQWVITQTDNLGVPVTPSVQIAVTDCTSAPCSGRDTNPAAGQFLVTGVPFGFYTLTETAAPAGHLIDPAPRGPLQISSRSTTAAFGAIANTKNTTTVIVRKVVQDISGSNPQPRSGWTVDAPISAVSPAGTVTTSGGAQTTSAAGSAQWTLTYTSATATATVTPAETQQSGWQFVSGSCTVTAADGSTRTVTLTGTGGAPVTGVAPDSTVDCTFTNKPIAGSISWSKVDRTGAALAGSEWVIRKTDSAGTPVTPAVTIAVTDCTSAPCAGADTNPAAGQFTVGTLALGFYTLQETAAPAGYILDATVRGPVTLDSRTPNRTLGAITNTVNTSTVIVRKVVLDVNGANPQAGIGWTMTAPLSGVSPAGTVSTSGGAQQTAPTGSTQWTLTYTAASATATVTPAETAQTGFRFVSGACTVIAVDGSTRTVTMATADGSAVTGVAPGSTVDCTYTNRVDNGPLTWTKVSPTGVLLAGSVWTVTKTDQLGVPVTPAVSYSVADCAAAPCSGPDTNPAVGRFALQALTGGFYTLTETMAPAGYQLESVPLGPIAVGFDEPDATFGGVVNTPSTAVVTIRKVVVDNQGNNPQPAAGWTMDAPISAVTPAGAVTTSGGAQQTDAQGSAQWTLTYTSTTATATVTPTETQQSSYTFVSGSCTVTDVNGLTRSITLPNEAGTAVAGISPGSAVDCTFTNRLREGALTWTKVGPSGQLLAGSEWTLTQTNALGVPVVPAVTIAVTDCAAAPCTGRDTNPIAGQFTVTGVGVGYYTLTETVAPTGYFLLAGARGPVLLDPAGASFGTIVDTPRTATVIERKVMLDVNGQNPTPTAGWRVNFNPSRLNGTITPAAGDQLTGADGSATWTMTFSANTDLTSATVSEYPTANARFVSGVCTITSASGAVRTLNLAGFTAQSIAPIAPGDVADCTWTNQLNSDTLTWTKTGSGGAALGGATFRVVQSDASGTPLVPTVQFDVTDCIAAAAVDCTGADRDPVAGSFSVTGIPAGHYTLQETVAPAGYTLNPTRFGPVSSQGTGATLSFGTVTNTEAPGAVTWRKIDQNGQPLAGSEWELRPVDGLNVIPVVDCVVASPGVCTGGRDEDPDAGEFLVTGVAAGQYQLVETKAPAGFVPLANAIGPVRVGALVGTASFGDIVNVRQGSVILPLSGGGGTTPFLAGGLGIGAAGIVAWLFFLGRRRRRTEELTGGSAEAPETRQGGMRL